MTDPGITSEDQRFMARALQLARIAEAMGEVPVGCVVTLDGIIVGEACNGSIGSRDPTAHAEIRALRLAGINLGNYRLAGCDLYVTLEPCLMCAGAMVHARLDRVIYGASDPKTGAAGSVFDVLVSEHHNHRLEVIAGVFSDECSTLLKQFFRQRRN